MILLCRDDHGFETGRGRWKEAAAGGRRPRPEEGGRGRKKGAADVDRAALKAVVDCAAVETA